MTRSLESLFDRYRTQGDLRALAKVFDRTAPDLLRTAMHLTRDPTVAEDLLQETFVAAIESAPRYDRHRPLAPWLAGILSNQARRHHRSNARRIDPTRLPPRRVPMGVGELEADVAQGIDALPKIYRQVVLLKVAFDMEPAQIAHLLDMPPATVRTRIHRGMEMLRARLRPGLALDVLPAPVDGLRGIGAIRKAVMSQATATAVTTTAASVAIPWALGGVVVTKNQVLGALAVVALAVAGGLLVNEGWFSNHTPSSEAPDVLAGQRNGGPELRGQRGLADGNVAEGNAVEEQVEQEDEEPEDAPRGLSGRVLDTQERAVAGARIEAWVQRGDLRTPLPPTKADGEGNYRVDLSALETWSSLQFASATLMVRAHANGYRPGELAEIELVGHMDSRTPQGDLSLVAGISVQGRVLDDRRLPVADATVALYRVPQGGQEWSGRTDAEGRYAIGAEESGLYAVAVRSSRGVARSDAQRVELGDATSFPDLVLGDAPSIQGRVLALDGSPLPGIELLAKAHATEDGQQAPPEAREHPMRVRTDTEGRFRLDAHWQGIYRITLRGAARQEIRVDAALHDHDVEIRLEDPVLVVRVRDAQGRPLPGADLSLTGWLEPHLDTPDLIRDGTLTRREASPFAHTDSGGDLRAADGTTMRIVPTNSRWIVSARITGAPPAEAIVAIDATQPVTRVDLVIQEPVPEGRLDVRVFKPDGSRLKNFAVFMSTPLGTGVGTPSANEDGALPSMDAGPMHVRVLPYARRNHLTEMYGVNTFLLPAKAQVTVPSGGSVPLTVKLREGGRFRLRLRYPDGEQPKTERLRLRILERNDDPAALQGGPVWVYETDRGTTVSNDFRPGEACLHARLLPPSDYRIEVATQNHGTHERRIRIRAGEIVDIVMDVGE